MVLGCVCDFNKGSKEGITGYLKALKWTWRWWIGLKGAMCPKDQLRVQICRCEV